MTIHSQIINNYSDDDIYYIIALLSKKYMPIFVVYRNPSDYPEQYVARLHIVDGTTNTPLSWIFIADSIEEIRTFRPPYMTTISRSTEDEPHIVETWI